MQRIRFGRITAAVAALCLSDAIQHSEEIYAMVNAVDIDGAVVPSAVHVSIEHFGVIHGLQIPFGGAQFAEMGPIKCAADPRMRVEVCASRRPTEHAFAAMVSSHWSKSGARQVVFDPVTTDTFVSQKAIVRTGSDRGGHVTDLTVRSTQRWSGVIPSSPTMTLNGADTTYSAVHRTSGVNRFTGIVMYSDVRIARHPSNIARNYPTSGIIHASAMNEWVTPLSTRPFYSNVIVYFDGTRTPDAYLDGARYQLDLDTGLALPHKGA